MMVNADVQLRPAVPADQPQITNLMHASPHVHRHLDWRYPLDWIGSPPFFVLERQGQLSAVLACSPDPPQVAWVRLFAAAGGLPLEETWESLWEAARHELNDRGKFTAAAIILQDWYQELLLLSGFATRQSIVLLEREGEPLAKEQGPIGYSIRSIRQNDLAAIAAVDAAAFDPLWQNSLLSLERAYSQAVMSTVMEWEGQVVGYQLSTRNPRGVHLARLAVRPELQGRGIGYALVADLIRQAVQYRITHLSVNTQSDNAASLVLYKRAGFRETGERYPVYQLQIP